jgi:hypothetical protein
MELQQIRCRIPRLRKFVETGFLGGSATFGPAAKPKSDRCSEPHPRTSAESAGRLIRNISSAAFRPFDTAGATENLAEGLFILKELRLIAQGCRASRLPWERVANVRNTPMGLRHSAIRDGATLSG